MSGLGEEIIWTNPNIIRTHVEWNNWSKLKRKKIMFELLAVTTKALTMRLALQIWPVKETI